MIVLRLKWKILVYFKFAITSKELNNLKSENEILICTEILMFPLINQLPQCIVINQLPPGARLDSGGALPRDFTVKLGRWDEHK